MKRVLVTLELEIDGDVARAVERLRAGRDSQFPLINGRHIGARTYSSICKGVRSVRLKPTKQSTRSTNRRK